MAGTWRRMAVAAALVALAAGSATAQGVRLPQGRWWENPRLVRRLGLTERQRERIRTLVYEHAQRMVDLNADVRHAELELERQVSGDAVDPDAARRAFDALVKARTALERERFELLLAVRQVLTPEQWETLKRAREALRERRARRRDELRRRPPGARRPLPPPGAPHPPP